MGQFSMEKSSPPGSVLSGNQQNGLVMMFGKSELARATNLYKEAARCPAADAMERLDVELAKSELEE